ncbi:MAG TPA: 5-formyltetrahydrofolate cyclo-ligase [Thermofilum sp.]|nr:5-formyltetrahydrofolate cyclo-ligase [Thermofilum sp.]
MSVMENKRQIRETVWKKLKEYNLSVGPCYGKIPNFIGSATAANKVIYSRFFRRAKVIYSTLDSPQKLIREAALLSGKTLVLSTPRLSKGFILLNPKEIPRNAYNYASTYRGAMMYGLKMESLEGLHIDMFIMGSVAVDRKGGRVGKGDGMQDLEYAVLRELGVIDDKTLTVTTVHDTQVMDNIPMELHDVPADIIGTPSELIVTNTQYPKPSGVIWDLISAERIASINILRQLSGFT